MNDLAGRVVLIAGALGTLGLTIAGDFRSQGATVYIAPDQPLPPELRARCTGLAVVDGALGDPGDLARRCNEIRAQHGRLDLVIVCSGTDAPPPPAEQPQPEAAAEQPSWLERWRALGRRALGASLYLASR